MWKREETDIEDGCIFKLGMIQAVLYILWLRSILVLSCCIFSSQTDFHLHFVVLCFFFFFYWHIVSKWRRDKKISSKDLIIFLILVSTPQNNVPCCRGHDRKGHFYSIFGCQLFLTLRNSAHMLYILYWPKMCFVLMRFGNHNFMLCLKTRGWIQSILCLFIFQCH